MGWPADLVRLDLFGDLIVVTSKGRSRPDQPHLYIGEMLCVCVCGTHADLWEGYRILFLRCAPDEKFSHGRNYPHSIYFLSQRVYPRPLFIFRTLKGNK
jgi:hypothetical protein